MSAATSLVGAAVVVVNYGSSALLEDNLVGSGLSDSAAAIVVVDNFSTTNEREHVHALGRRHGWTVLDAPNGGFGAGCDLGSAAATADGNDVLVLLNPDATIAPDDLSRLVALVRAEPLTVASPAITRPDGSRWFSGLVVDLDEAGTRRPRPDDSPTRTRAWLAGTCVVIATDLYTALDGFDERYFLYWEDVDLSWRAIGHGARLVVMDDVHAVHAVGATQTTTTGKSPLYCYWNCRNRLLFAAAHLDRRDRRRWAARSVPYAIEVVLRGGRRAALLHPSTTWAALRGTLAGVRLLARAGRASGTEPVAPSTRPDPRGAHA
jgi:N-acetylglucosaminyl-diphospho-decaprenol L-rhamnosyltransferase